VRVEEGENRPSRESERGGVARPPKEKKRSQREKKTLKTLPPPGGGKAEAERHLRCDGKMCGAVSGEGRTARRRLRKARRGGRATERKGA